MQEKPKRLKKGQARIEYFAVRNEITELANRGFDLTAIHKQLTESGQITMSYKGLYENHNYQRLRKKKKDGISQHQPIGHEHSPVNYFTESPGASSEPINNHHSPLPKRPQSAALGVIVSPKAKAKGQVISAAIAMAKNQAKAQEFTESQPLPDENPENRQLQIDKLVGEQKK